MAAAYKRGLQQPQIGPDLHGGGGMLMFWSHEPVAPWQDEAWLSDMRRSLRPNQYLRMIENRFVTSESQFIDMAAWDACVQASLTPSMERVPVWIGVDASTKRDSTALVAVSFDKATSCVRLVAHRVFTPTAGTRSTSRRRWSGRSWSGGSVTCCGRVLFDPYQMQSVAQRLAKAHVPIEEYPQTIPNLTASTSALFDLIKAGRWCFTRMRGCGWPSRGRW
jgi:hypothetical protein